jgi:acetyl-CoA synthetase
MLSMNIAVFRVSSRCKGNALYGFVILKETGEYRNRENLTKEINQQISNQIGPIAKLDKFSL